MIELERSQKMTYHRPVREGIVSYEQTDTKDQITPVLASSLVA